MSRLMLSFLVLAASQSLFSETTTPLSSEETPRTLLSEPAEFDRSSLMSGGGNAGFSWLDRSRFSMNQSYSVSFTSGGGLSHSSGIYLNTLTYRLADPLLLRVDMGFHTPFFSGSGFGGDSRDAGFLPQSASFILPHVGLEYRPTENSLISIHFINGPDAWKAYGPHYPHPLLTGQR